MASWRGACQRRMWTLRYETRSAEFYVHWKFIYIYIPFGLGKRTPDWPKLLHLYSRLKPGKTVYEWMKWYDVESLGIDVRRFTSFGVVKVSFLDSNLGTAVQTLCRVFYDEFIVTLFIYPLIPLTRQQRQVGRLSTHPQVRLTKWRTQSFSVGEAKVFPLEQRDQV